jgi:hypothetical protein
VVGSWFKRGDRKCICCPAGTRAFKHLYCIDCLPGYYSRPSSEVRTPCAAGQVSQPTSSTVRHVKLAHRQTIYNRCKKCTLDTYSLRVVDSCNPCQSGSFSAMGLKKCLCCGSGKYFDKERRACVRYTSGSSGQPGCTVTAAPTEPPTLPPISSCPAGY